MSTDLVLEPLEMPPRAASPFAEEAEDKMHEQVVQARLWKIFTQEMTTESFVHHMRELVRWGEARGLSRMGCSEAGLLIDVAECWNWLNIPSKADAWCRGLVQLYTEDGAAGTCFMDHLWLYIWPHLTLQDDTTKPLEEKLRHSAALGLVTGRAQVHWMAGLNGHRLQLMHIEYLWRDLWPLLNGTLDADAQKIRLPALCAWLLAGGSEVRRDILQGGYISALAPECTLEVLVQRLSQLLETLDGDEMSKQLLLRAIHQLQDSTQPDLTSEETWQAVTENAWWADRLKGTSKLYYELEEPTTDD